MASVVNMDPPDLKRLQLLLQGSISAQVNQGVQEYTVFLMEPHCSAREFSSHVERLGEAYRYIMCSCAVFVCMYVRGWVCVCVCVCVRACV